ncbi:MAG: acyl-CoA dehydrogenase family protein [Chloroflexi bacterium]|nr:acyl-CoA dehydrogenase family protein [Chloroflexota bacterium]
MDFRFNEEQVAFQQEIRAFFAEEMAPEKTEGRGERKEMYGYDLEFERALRRKTGDRGYLGVAWPEEYGGQAKGMFYQAILGYEAAYAAAPAVDIGVSIVAAPLMLFGTPEQKEFFLPKILKGEINFCLGYSEPGAGSDLASLETRAEIDGDDFVITGQKIFTTGAHKADYCWLAARTDPEAPKHKGISLMIVDMASPGITPRPLWTIAGWRHNEMFLDHVRVPKTNLIGELHRGWYQVATALDFERSGFASYGTAQRGLEKLVAYCKQHWRNGRPLSQDPLVRAKLAQVAIDISVGLRFTKLVAWMQAEGQVPNHEASVNKIWGSELLRRLSNEGMRVLGLYGALDAESPHAPAGGWFPHEYLHSLAGTIGAGSNEIQRNVIAQRGLGMPR